MESAILSTITFVCLIAYVAYEKFLFPKQSAASVASATEIVTTVEETAKKLSLVVTMAKKFVILAKKEFKDGQGEEKKNWVIMQLRSLCEKLDLVLSNEELEAINEDAYVTMKRDETN